MLVIVGIARSTITLALVLGYLGAGLAAGVRLARRGHALGLVASAVIGWPLLAGVLFGPAIVPTRKPIAGPFAARIGLGLTSLRRSLIEAHGESPIELASPAQLNSLELALRQADDRVASVDRLIAELESGPGSQSLTPEFERARATSLASLRLAREHAADELEQVLAMLLQVRVQIGLQALSGPATVAPVRERLAELEARVAALAELSSFDPSRPSLPMEGC
jgi:hypothetical protein